MKILTSQSQSAGKRIHGRIVVYGMLGWGLRFLERCLALVVIWFVLIGLSVWLETALRLRPWPSLVFRLAGLLPVLVLGFFWFRGLFRDRPTIGSLSRDLERKVPNLYNRLVTVIEFRRDAALPDQGILRYFSPGLVNAFFAEAQQTLRRRSFLRVVFRPAFAGAVAGLLTVLVVASLLPHFTVVEWQTVLNLYFAPFHQNPFYDPSALLVEPGNAQVAVGDDLTIRARMTGGGTRNSEILFRSGQTLPDAVPMQRDQDGSFIYEFRNLQESIWYRVTAGKKRSPEYEIRVVKSIHLTGLSILLSYPSYTGIGLEFGGEEEGSIEAPIGTRCQLTAQFDEVASEAALYLREAGGKESETQKMEDTAAGWEAEFTVLQDGLYSISAEWEGGSPGESPVYSIRAIRDASPSLRLLSPRGDVDLSGKVPFPSFVSFREGIPHLTVRYRAADDYGLRESHLVVEDMSGTALERVPMHAYTGRATSAEETYPWSLRDWWGGEDIWICVEIKDSLAARPDLGREFYSQEEIARHVVRSRKVHLTWSEQPEIALDQSRKSGEESEQGEGTGEGENPKTKEDQGADGRDALQIARDVGEIRKEQQQLNREVDQARTGESGEGDGEEQSQSGSEGDGQPDEGEEDGGDQADALGKRQRSLAERTAKAEAKARALAAAYRTQSPSGTDSPGGNQQGGGAQSQGTRDLTEAARDLDRVADNLGRRSVKKGERLEPGVGSRMEQNAGDLQNRRWDQAGARGEEIARDLQSAEDMLERIAQLAGIPSAEDNDQPRGPGEKQEQVAEAEERREESQEQRPGGGKVAPEQESPEVEGAGGQASAEETQVTDPSAAEGGGPGGPGGSVYPAASAQMNPFSVERFSLPENYMTDLGEGEGTEPPVRPGELEPGEGMAHLMDKVPKNYRDEVNRYYELLENP